MEWITWLLRTILMHLPPIEMALTLGAIFFALSWLRPRRIVSLPASGRRAETLAWLGIAGSLIVVGVGSLTSWLATLNPSFSGDGWWQRPAPLLAAAAVMAIAVIALHREPLPSPGERLIAPRRRWWHFAPRVPLWITATAGTLLLLMAGWQTLIGVSAPRDADHYGIGPGWTQLPGYTPIAQGYFWGAGWPNHLATLVALVLAATAFALVLGGDANRPVPARRTAAQIAEEREATARLITFIGLGAVLLTLGAVWAFVGFVGQISIGIGLDELRQPVIEVGTGYGAFAPFMHLGGYVVQGIGAAVLLRLATDTLRALLAGRRVPTADPDVAPAGSSAAASSTGTGTGTDSDPAPPRDPASPPAGGSSTTAEAPAGLIESRADR
ncbi:MAG: hypothetical protein QM606_02610 [Leucobacter sp.]